MIVWSFSILIIFGKICEKKAAGLGCFVFCHFLLEVCVFWMDYFFGFLVLIMNFIFGNENVDLLFKI